MARIGSWIVLVLLGTVPAAAGQPTVADVPDKPRPGEKITVTTTDGSQVTGRLLSLSPASLGIMSDGGQRTVPASQVTRVVVKDPIRNGLLIGAAAGAGAGLAGGLAVNAICVNETGACPGAVALLAGIGAAAGAAIGAGLDGLRHRVAFDAVPGVPGEYAPEFIASAGAGRSAGGIAAGSGFAGPPNVGVAWAMRHTSGFGFTLDASRTVGRATHRVSCADAPSDVPVANCVGDGEQGVVDTTTASATAQYYFSRSRVQPYVSGGAAVYQDSLAGVRTVQTPWMPRPVALQSLERSKGVAFAAGGGARIVLTDHLALHPAMTLYKADNWTHVRASVGAGVGW
jgi:hypothetical protein